MKVLVLTPYLYDTAPGQRFRIEQWAQILSPLGVQFHFVPFESAALKRVLQTEGHYVRKIIELLRGIYRRIQLLASIGTDWDTIFLHRELLPVGPPFLERLLVRKGIPVIYDFDDAIFLPDASEANQRFQWLKWSKKNRRDLPPQYPCDRWQSISSGLCTSTHAAGVNYSNND